jgi:hypothetical protein
MPRFFALIISLFFVFTAQAAPPRGSVLVLGGGGENTYHGPYKLPDEGGYGDGNDDGNYEDQPNYVEQEPEYNDDDGYQSPGDKGQPQGPSSDETENLYAKILEFTNGACDIKINPHSFACNEWNYKNNPVFPLFAMDWDGLQGDWFSVTYAEKGRENNGGQFYMAKNIERPTQPMGVKNQSDDSLLGRVWISGTKVTFENWHGHKVSSDPQSFKVLDDYTVQFDLWTGAKGKQTLHSFDCRDFNRNNEHHLLCDWWVRTGTTDDSWVFKGYFGFIRLEVWQGFLNQAGGQQ